MKIKVRDKLSEAVLEVLFYATKSQRHKVTPRILNIF
jgi:hypothetical protein